MSLACRPLHWLGACGHVCERNAPPNSSRASFITFVTSPFLVASRLCSQARWARSCSSSPCRTANCMQSSACSSSRAKRSARRLQNGSTRSMCAWSRGRALPCLTRFAFAEESQAAPQYRAHGDRSPRSPAQRRRGVLLCVRVLLRWVALGLRAQLSDADAL